MFKFSMALLFFISTTYANEATEFFDGCQSGPNLNVVRDIDTRVKILNEKTYLGCPLTLAFEAGSTNNIMFLQSVRDGVSGGQYSARYDDIRPFVYCSYDNNRESLGCGLKDELVTEDILNRRTVEALKEAQKAWLDRNK